MSSWAWDFYEVYDDISRVGNMTAFHTGVEELGRLGSFAQEKSQNIRNPGKL